ncbi:hypothetical protein [Roseimaritima ulvae]|uniref:Uncharacterized protein n=1 Tax=Roseimaritima ulvae TaxID=980254 RepID=A0A5B9QQN4_9BACT|nr:hypothetical protein [Roseimaritima ulvae]QEG41304.1 hypothetical protein UC8_33230 [Roseimaritima ulvae]
MTRFISLLLIPFLVLGQCLPHSHAGSGVAEPDGHALRPHVHLHAHDHAHGDHHEHADESESSSPSDSLSPAADHDSDAVYLIASGQSLTRTSGAIETEVHSADWIALPVSLTVDIRPRWRTSDTPVRYRTMPIYLLTASLRL